jgi:hypothetical protein
MISRNLLYRIKLGLNNPDMSMTLSFSKDLYELKDATSSVTGLERLNRLLAAIYDEPSQEMLDYLLIPDDHYHWIAFNPSAYYEHRLSIRFEVMQTSRGSVLFSRHDNSSRGFWANGPETPYPVIQFS